MSTAEKPVINRIKIDGEKNTMFLYRDNCDDSSYFVGFSDLKLMLFEKGVLFGDDKNALSMMNYIAHKVLPEETKKTFLPADFLAAGEYPVLDENIRQSIDHQIAQLSSHKKAFFYDRKVLN